MQNEEFSPLHSHLEPQTLSIQSKAQDDGVTASRTQRCFFEKTVTPSIPSNPASVVANSASYARATASIFFGTIALGHFVNFI